MFSKFFLVRVGLPTTDIPDYSREMPFWLVRKNEEQATITGLAAF